MRTPEEIVDTEYSRPNTTLADVVRIAVREAVSDFNKIIIDSDGDPADEIETRVYDHFAKAGY